MESGEPGKLGEMRFLKKRAPRYKNKRNAKPVGDIKSGQG